MAHLPVASSCGGMEPATCAFDSGQFARRHFADSLDVRRPTQPEDKAPSGAAGDHRRSGPCWALWAQSHRLATQRHGGERCCDSSCGRDLDRKTAEWPFDLERGVLTAAEAQGAVEDPDVDVPYIGRDLSSLYRSTACADRRMTSAGGAGGSRPRLRAAPACSAEEMYPPRRVVVGAFRTACGDGTFRLVEQAAASPPRRSHQRRLGRLTSAAAAGSWSWTLERGADRDQGSPSCRSQGGARLLGFASRRCG